ncbi:MAG TPA: chemotaxis protein CheB [Azoarcus taiwanensis]|nr:chemotaxis protein CheB [Azoarcus taiwanensis]
MDEPDTTAQSSSKAHDASHPAAGSNFPVVGIGASAGGLEALERFLSGVPPDSGIAYVVIQHLDPTHKGMMPELLQRTTSLPVEQARDRLKIKPNHVYVLPPNRDMSLLGGELHLFKPTAPRGQRLPIDFFLRTLAVDQRQQAVGVLLSGMGSDGTAGLRAIKENAGLALVQDPADAAFSSMPQSGIDSGMVDIVAPAAALPGRIIAALRQGAIADETDPVADDQLKSGLAKVVILMRAHNGQDFSRYKKSTLYRRIERRMGIHQIRRIADYVRLLQENPQELDLLFREFLIGVTGFFRDPAAWDSLRDVAFPALFARSPSGRALRAWVPGCSTGEEAYSLAIIFKEALERHKPAGRYSLQIFGTDLAHDAIDQARQGHYSQGIKTEVSADRLTRYFIPTDDGYQVGKEVREMVIFAPQNMAQDPPFTKLDLLSCRNVLIYFTAELQKRLLALFHYSLVPGGVLFLGNSETIGSATELFAPLDSKSRLYKSVDIPSQILSVDFPTRFSAPHGPLSDLPSTPPAANLQMLADQLLLRQFAPAAVLTNERGDIVYINGRTGRYLEPAAGKANWNVHAMARDGLRQALGEALQQVVSDHGRVERHDVAVEDDGKTSRVDLTVQYIEDPEALRGMVMIVFAPLRSTSPARRRKKAGGQSSHEAELELTLMQSRDEVRNLRDRMQTSEEELKSTNEELQSTNEELQSTNEELTTSKEEMQSLNEELQTVNVELQSKVDDLSRVNDDMQNLLNSTEIATIFLDDRLHVRRFTPHAARIIKLIGADVGRPLSDLASDLDYPEFESDAREVLRTLIFSERPVATRDGRWFRVRIMPYRTMQNIINGVVITFIDISVAKRLEAELRAAISRAGDNPPDRPE